MARGGMFGGIVFSVSDNTVRTFDDMSWKFSASYATHDRHIQADILEFLGPEPDEITFSMVLSAYLGINPSGEIETLRQYVKNGIAERLVIGGRVYGDFKWVISQCSTELKRFDGNGNLTSATVKVTMKEYPSR